MKRVFHWVKNRFQVPENMLQVVELTFQALQKGLLGDPITTPPMFRFPQIGQAIAMLLVVAFQDARAEPQVADEIPVSEEYVLRTWDVNDGLPNDHVSGLAQTPDGYLWIATWWGGLVRFDGVHFTPISLETTPGIGENLVHTAFTSRDGTLWLGLERGGVARKRGGKFEMVIPPGASTGSVVATSSLVEDPSGGIWFAYNPDPKVFRLTGTKLTSFSSKEGVNLGNDPFVHLDGKGNVWFSARTGCAVFKENRFQTIDLGTVGGRLAPEKGGGM